ncbi:MAG: DUF2784 domain-containing protein [Ferruginibacter sp.]|nr:DUF2784 domain-containing protein [Chitinophagaceae bacterium]
MLQLLDLFYTILHLAIIGFNLFGWTWQKTRKAHLIGVAITAACWFVLGIWYGWGYCPVTDWQWKVKEKLGETGLPNSFVEYFAERISGKNFNTSLVDRATLFSFIGAILLSLYYNFARTKKKPLQA